MIVEVLDVGLERQQPKAAVVEALVVESEWDELLSDPDLVENLSDIGHQTGLHDVFVIWLGVCVEELWQFATGC